MKIDRRDFARRMVCAGTALALAPVTVLADEDHPPYGPAMINEFVRAGHNDLGRVKEMLGEHPNLLNSTWNWGGGDFETAIGGAGHVGNTEIAEYLIAVGARVNLFVLAMLGRTELVKPVLEAYPSLVFANGPHGFTMLHHAKQGGDNAAELYDFLRSKGLEKTKVEIPG